MTPPLPFIGLRVILLQIRILGVLLLCSDALAHDTYGADIIHMEDKHPPISTPSRYDSAFLFYEVAIVSKPCLHPLIEK